LTRRQLGWAYLGVGAVVLAAWPLSKLSSALAARSLAKLTPAPVATIDVPATSDATNGELLVEGTAVHETIRAPLWLLSSDGGPWEPEGPIATATGAWQQQVWLRGKQGTRYRLSVVAAELPLHDRYKRLLADVERSRRRHMYADEPGPVWWLRRATLTDLRLPPLPDGATAIASVDVVVDRQEVWGGPLMLEPKGSRPPSPAGPSAPDAPSERDCPLLHPIADRPAIGTLPWRQIDERLAAATLAELLGARPVSRVEGCWVGFLGSTTVITFKAEGLDKRTWPRLGPSDAAKMIEFLVEQLPGLNLHPSSYEAVGKRSADDGQGNHEDDYLLRWRGTDIYVLIREYAG